MSYSIEFAHIYTDEKPNGNHFESAKILRLLKQLSNPKSTSVVLVDNYNAKNDGFRVNKFLQALAKAGAKPDFYALESDIVPFSEVLLKSIQKPKIARMYRSYIERKKLFPCSLLTATWYLIRLGYIDGLDVFQTNNLHLKTKAAVADKLINILPVSFREIEKDAHQLIGYTVFKESRYKIQPVLFEEKGPVREGFLPERVR